MRKSFSELKTKINLHWEFSFRIDNRSKIYKIYMNWVNIFLSPRLNSISQLCPNFVLHVKLSTEFFKPHSSRLLSTFLKEFVKAHIKACESWKNWPSSFRTPISYVRFQIIALVFYCSHIIENVFDKCLNFGGAVRNWVSIAVAF